MKNPRTWITKLHIRENAVEITNALLYIRWHWQKKTPFCSSIFVEIRKEKCEEEKKMREMDQQLTRSLVDLFPLSRVF